MAYSDHPSAPVPSSRNIPPGLEPLLSLSQIILDHKNGGGGFLGDDASYPGFYMAQGPMIYRGEEKLRRVEIRKGFEFQVHVRDLQGNGILLDRPGSCCTQSAITVTALSTGQILGQVEPHCVCGGIGFFVVDPNGNRVAVVRPPTSWGCSSRTDIKSPSKVVFGQINKTRGSAWDSGPCVMTFPQDLEVGMKAVLLGVLVLVDAWT